MARRNSTTEYEAEIGLIMAELKSVLKIKEDDNSPAAQVRISSEISKELSEAILSRVDRQKVRSDIGNRALLPMSGYKVRFQPDGYVYSRDGKFSRQRTVVTNQAFIEKICTHPDLVQHFPHIVASHDGGLTLLASFFKGRGRNKRDSWVIVHAARGGDTLLVQAAWQLFPHLISDYKFETPLDIFRLFTDRYGVDFSVGALFSGSLIVGLTVPMTEEAYRLYGRDKSNFTNRNVQYNHTSISILANGTSSILIEIGYATDMDLYKRDMSLLA
jgi:hypothetical protein